MNDHVSVVFYDRVHTNEVVLFDKALTSMAAFYVKGHTNDTSEPNDRRSAVKQRRDRSSARAPPVPAIRH